jgi:hypothetical protein
MRVAAAALAPDSLSGAVLDATLAWVRAMIASRFVTMKSSSITAHRAPNSAGKQDITARTSRFDGTLSGRGVLSLAVEEEHCPI